jgi:hypothetical protein
MAHVVDLARVVRSVDSILRQRQGIRDFTEDPDCLFRISLTAAAAPLRLGDGTAIAVGDPIVELHFWNEHLPAMPESGPSAAWAVRLARQMRKSLSLLDRHLDEEPSLNSVVALTGAPPFGSRIGEVQMARTGRRFGFEILDPEPNSELGDRVHMVFDSMLLWGLGWAFNRPGLRSKGLLRHRYRLWISRAALHARFHEAPAPFDKRN